MSQVAGSAAVLATPGISMASIVGVGVGAALGAWLRWGMSLLLNRIHPHFPLGTWSANLLGGLLIGVALAWFGRHPEIDPVWRLTLVTGFLGALTTFSTFSIESLLMLQKGQLGWAALHSGAHLFGSLAAAAIGYRLTAFAGQ